MKYFRFSINFLAFIYYVIKTMVYLFLFHKYSEKQKMDFIQKHIEQFFKFIKIHLTVEGDEFVKNNEYLLVSNHVSWFDPLLVLKIIPYTRFIAKEEVKKWPLIGSLSRSVGTVFIRREKGVYTNFGVKEVTKNLSLGKNIGLYPEGTTTDGKGILPFKISYFQAAIDAKVKILPLFIHYINENHLPDEDIAYINEMTLMKSMFLIFQKKSVKASLTFLKPIDTENKTKAELAEETRSAIYQVFIEKCSQKKE